jgi:hypothetical protein
MHFVQLSPAMKTTVLLDQFEARGIMIEAAGNRLKLTAPTGVLTDDDRTQLKRLKPELLALLQSGAANDAPTGTMRAVFLSAVEAARREDCPGLVKMSSELVALWQAAEVEAGYPLDLSGQPRRIKSHCATCTVERPIP